MNSLNSLIRIIFKRSFLSLYIAQYLGAFNDNFFRTAMATFVTYGMLSIPVQSKTVIVSAAVGLFMLPFFLFSALAGELAEYFINPRAFFKMHKMYLK